MMSRFLGRGLPWIPLALAPFVTAGVSYAASFTYEIFSSPGNGQIIGRDINENNDIVGTVDDFSSGTRKPTGFVRRGGVISLIDAPGSEPLNGTNANGINNAGQIVGRFTEQEDTGIRLRGFILESGVLEPFDVPDSSATEPWDINNLGAIVGRTFLGQRLDIGTAFVRLGQEYTFFRPDEVQAPFGISFNGVNDAGNAVGGVLDGTGFRSFAVLNGEYMPFQIPGSFLSAASGINNANQIVGYFYDGSGTHGFLMDASGLYQVDVAASQSHETFLMGINDLGVLVGAIGFNRFPVREVLVGTPCSEGDAGCLPAPRIGDALIDFGLTVEIDMKPGSRANTINPSARGVIPVALLGSDQFHVSEVVLDTLELGPDGATPVGLPEGGHKDVNGDGLVDLVVHFRTAETGLAWPDTEACLRGELRDGRRFKGCDSIHIVPARGEEGPAFSEATARGGSRLLPR